MRAIGRANAAITFVNALSTGVGAAAGIDLPIEAIVDLEGGPANSRVEIDPASDTPLVRAMTGATLHRWGGGRGWSVRVRIRSSIPPARGLKSSSAVAGAVARGVSSAIGSHPSNEEIAKLGADVSQAIGLSATGAFDDGMAALSPGLHVTNNAERRRLRHDPLPSAWEVVLWIPPRTHQPSPAYRGRFRELRTEGLLAQGLALGGEPLRAMEANTTLVEKALELDYHEVRDRLTDRGALGSGVSGMGPTLAAITDRDHLAEVLRALPPGRGEVIVTRFDSTPASGAE